MVTMSSMVTMSGMATMSGMRYIPAAHIRSDPGTRSTVLVTHAQFRVEFVRIRIRHLLYLPDWSN